MRDLLLIPVVFLAACAAHDGESAGTDLPFEGESDGMRRSRVVGGTPEERGTVADAFRGVPACFATPGGEPLEVRVVSSEDLLARGAPPHFAFNATYVPPERAGQLAPFFGLAAEELADRITVTDGILPASPLAGDRRDGLASACLDDDALFGPGRLGAFMLHESAHRLHLHEPARIEPFLAIAAERRVAAFEADPAVRAIRAQIAADDGTRRCELKDELWQQYVAHGLPARWPNDMHAIDDGREYFAIAIEMLRHYPEAFCATYTEAERQWLATNLGGCIAQLPLRASCL